MFAILHHHRLCLFPSLFAAYTQLPGCTTFFVLRVGLIVRSDTRPSKPHREIGCNTGETTHKALRYHLAVAISRPGPLEASTQGHDKHCLDLDGLLHMQLEQSQPVRLGFFRYTRKAREAQGQCLDASSGASGWSVLNEFSSRWEGNGSITSERIR